MREPSRCTNCPRQRLVCPQRIEPMRRVFRDCFRRVNLPAEVFLATAVSRYTAAAVSDRGRKRPSNEDAYGFSIEAGVYVVCDGMGGAAAGEIASTIAVDEVLRLLTQREPQNETPLPVAAQSAICAANDAIF